MTPAQPSDQDDSGSAESSGNHFLLAFFLLAFIAGISVLAAYLGMVYGVVATGFMMTMRQLALKQASEGIS